MTSKCDFRSVDRVNTRRDLTRIALHKAPSHRAALLAVGLIVGIGPAQAKPNEDNRRAQPLHPSPQERDGAQCRGLRRSHPTAAFARPAFDVLRHHVGDEHYDLPSDPSALPNGKITYEGLATRRGVEGCGTGTTSSRTPTATSHDEVRPDHRQRTASTSGVSAG